MDGVQSSVNPSDYTAVQQGPDPTTNNHLLSCLKEEYAVVARGLDPLPNQKVPGCFLAVRLAAWREPSTSLNFAQPPADDTTDDNTIPLVHF